MKKLRAFFLGLLAFILGTCAASCDKKESNLTEQTQMSQAIRTLASPSSVFAECYIKNATTGTGGNVLNPICARAYCLYERAWADKYCREHYQEDGECFDKFTGKDCNNKR